MILYFLIKPALTALHNRRFLDRSPTRTVFQGVCSTKNVVYKSHFSKKGLVMSLGNNDKLHVGRVSSFDHDIVHFYDHINNKNLKKVADFVSDDCCFEDYSFLEPFRGKKEVMHFLEELIECMGKNVKFVIENVCQEDQFSVAIIWCLEWKGKPIPLTRGCSFCECSKQEGKLVLKHARAMVEWPIKPGALILSLFKLVMYLFDEFPGATEKFLQRPKIVLQFLLRIYNLFLEPFIQPIITCYIDTWKFVVRLFIYMLSIMFHIIRMFSNKRKD